MTCPYCRTLGPVCICSAQPRRKKKPRTQARREQRTLSVSAKFYERLQDWCDENGQSVAGVVERVLGEVLP